MIKKDSIDESRFYAQKNTWTRIGVIYLVVISLQNLFEMGL